MKKVAIILTHYKEHAERLSEEINHYCTQKGIAVSMIDADARIETISLDSTYDLAISLGGDGTVLYAVQLAAPHDIPVFPVNLGQFGFIAGIVLAYTYRNAKAKRQTKG